MKILITGSRDWGVKGVAPETDRLVLEKYLERYATPGSVVLHGACPTGADQLAQEWCELNDVEYTRFPPDPSQGKRGYYLRNQAMVDEKPDLVLAFLLGESRGTSMTVELARATGLRVGFTYAAGTLLDGELFDRKLRL